MRTNTLKNFKNILITITGIVLFVGTQVRPHEKDTLFQAFILVLVVMSFNFMLWSDKGYNQFISDGIKISHRTYQIIGLFFIFIQLIIYINAYWG